MLKKNPIIEKEICINLPRLFLANLYIELLSYTELRINNGTRIYSVFRRSGASTDCSITYVEVCRDIAINKF